MTSAEFSDFSTPPSPFVQILCSLSGNLAYFLTTPPLCGRHIWKPPNGSPCKNVSFPQATDFWKNVLKPAERERLVDNIASHLCNAQQFIQVGGAHFFGILGNFCRNCSLMTSQGLFHKIGLYYKPQISF